jgi:hypothetical protein
LRAGERLSARALARMWNGCIDNDATAQILTAWAAKEELRRLLHAAARGGHRHEINARLYDFYTWCADADIPELTTLAETIETWWPAVAGLPSDTDHQRPHRRLQPTDQAHQARRLRIPQPKQLSSPGTPALHTINSTESSVKCPLPDEG